MEPMGLLLLVVVLRLNKGEEEEFLMKWNGTKFNLTDLNGIEFWWRGQEMMGKGR